MNCVLVDSGLIRLVRPLLGLQSRMLRHAWYSYRMLGEAHRTGQPH